MGFQNHEELLEMLESLKAELTTVGTKWDDLSAQVRDHTEKLALVDNHGSKLDEQGHVIAKLGEHGAKFDELVGSLQQTQQEHSQLKLIIAELEKKSQRGGMLGDDENDYTAPGKSFVEGTAYKEFAAGLDVKSRRESAIHKVKGGFFGVKSSSDVTSPAIYTPRADPKEFAKRVPVHRGYIPVIQVGDGNTVPYTREKVEYQLVARVTAQASTGQKVVYVDNTRGMLTDTGLNTYTSHSTPGGAAENSGTIASIDHDNLKLTMTDNLTVQLEIGDLIYCPFFDFVAEANIAPKSQDVWEAASATIIKLASHVKVSVDLLDDEARMEDITERRLLSRIARDEESMVFRGAGGSGQMEGFLNDSDITTITWSAQAAGTTRLDMIMLALTYPALSDYMATAVFMSWTDWRQTILTKGTDGQYVLLKALSEAPTSRILGADLVPCNALPATYFVAGDFAMGATLFERDEAEVQIGLDGNDLTQDTRTLFGRERVALAIDCPGAFAIGYLDSSP